MKIEVSAVPPRHWWPGRVSKGHWLSVQAGSQRESSNKLCTFTSNVQGQKSNIPFLVYNIIYASRRRYGLNLRCLWYRSGSKVCIFLIHWSRVGVDSPTSNQAKSSHRCVLHLWIVALSEIVKLTMNSCHRWQPRVINTTHRHSLNFITKFPCCNYF